MALFLALRKVDPNKGRGLGTLSAAQQQAPLVTSPDGLPIVNRLYNLYQPYDPVAYR